MKAFLLALAVLISLSIQASADAPVGASPDTAGLGYVQRLGALVPVDADLVDQTGRRLTLRDAMDGKPTLLILGWYACPGLCGLIRNDVFAALTNSTLRTPDNYRLIFLSIDPSETTEDAARAFRRDAEQTPVPGAAKGWTFATSDGATVARLENAVGYKSRFDEALKQFLHPAGVVVLTPSGQISSYLLGVTFQPRAMEAAVGRAAGGQIGQEASPILLLCFHYDPVTGRYTLAIMKVLRIMAALAVLTVAGIVVLLRRPRRSA